MARTRARNAKRPRMQEQPAEAELNASTIEAHTDAEDAFVPVHMPAAGMPGRPQDSSVPDWQQSVGSTRQQAQCSQPGRLPELQNPARCEAERNDQIIREDWSRSLSSTPLDPLDTNVRPASDENAVPAGKCRTSDPVCDSAAGANKLQNGNAHAPQQTVKAASAWQTLDTHTLDEVPDSGTTRTEA
jgi:hypothetical protein